MKRFGALVALTVLLGCGTGTADAPVVEASTSEEGVSVIDAEVGPSPSPDPGAIFRDPERPSGAASHPAPTSHTCNSVDRAHLYHSNRAFALDWRACLKQSLGIEGITTRCMKTRYKDLSHHCASCFGEFGVCARHKCTKECVLDTNSPQCIACATDRCLEPFLACTGVSRDEVPWAD